MHSFAVQFDLSNPPSVFGLPRNALKTGSIVDLRPDIPSVFRICCLAQIDQSIVVKDAVDMVDLIFGPASVNVKPRKSMSKIGVPIDLYSDVSAADVSSM